MPLQAQLPHQHDVTNFSVMLPQFGRHVTCSNSLFREYYKQMGYFPSKGKWRHVGVGKYRVSYFQPNICHFQWPNVSWIAKHFSAKDAVKPKRILITGASQGNKYTGGMSTVLKSAGFVCKYSAKVCLEIYTLHKTFRVLNILNFLCSADNCVTYSIYIAYITYTLHKKLRLFNILNAFV